MSTAPGPADLAAQSAAGTIAVPDFFSPASIVARLSEVRRTQPIAALAAANQHREALTDIFLQAVERGLTDPRQDFEQHGMLFNYSAYFLAKWREPRARPLFLRWFGLAGEDALELGGDTVTHHGARFLASVCGPDVVGAKQLIENRQAHASCRGQAIRALGVLAAWGEATISDVEGYFNWLAREGLERTRNEAWSDLAWVCAMLGWVSVFSELRRAVAEGLVATELVPKEAEEAGIPPREALLENFAQLHPRIEDVIRETAWWAGFQRPEMAGDGQESGHTYVAPPKVGRNDPCPCGSGKKFKKCCGV
jgi:hypothetical protein